MKPLRLLALFVIPLGIIIAAVPPDRVKHFRLTADELLQEAGAGVQFVSPDVVADMLVQKDPSLRLIDVRTPEEFASGFIAGAVNIPVDQLSQRLNEVPQDEPVVVYCHSGNRSHQASQILEDAGYSQVYDLGGISQWQAAGMPVQR